MNISKEEVLSILTTQPNGNIEESNFKKKFPEFYKEVLSMSFPEDFKFTQKLYHYFHNDPELKLGLCIICGNRCKFLSFIRGYHQHCSKNCIKKDKNNIIEKRKQTCLERYNIDNYAKTKECREKMKMTCFKKYGVEHNSQTPEYRQKYEQTCLERYGVDNPSKCNQIKEKRKQTCLERYGAEYYSKTDECREKIKETCQEKYGVDIYAKTKECREKMKMTCQEKYGCDYSFQSPEVKDKIVNTQREKYGVDHYSQTDEFKKRIKNTCQEKYGTDSYVQTKEYRERYKQTCLERYGVDHYSQSYEFHKNHRKQIPYKDLTFDSSWEVEVYKFCEEHSIPCEYQPNIQFMYEYNGKTHIYQPDFLINGKLYEVKGDQFFEDGKMINPFDRSQDELFESKHQCMIQNNVNIITSKQINILKSGVNIFN